MYQELGLLCVLLLPAVLIYLYRSESIEKNDNPDDTTTQKSKKKKKKTKGKANDKKDASTLKQPSSPLKHESSKKHVQEVEAADAVPIQEEVPKATEQQTTVPAAKPAQKEAPAKSSNKAESKEVDEHMDLTPKYSRVMRITAEQVEDDWEPVPYEEGWESIGSSKKQIHSVSREAEAISKKQRENQAKAAKKKSAKATADALQAERLRRHQRELEKEKINEFYSVGAGKNSPWGKKPQKGSSKTPTGKASLNESGKLIWD